MQFVEYSDGLFSFVLGDLCSMLKSCFHESFPMYPLLKESDGTL